MAKKKRLQKRIQESGLLSRRKTDEAIFAGRILINSKAASHPAQLVSDADEITIDGKALPKKRQIAVITFNKPKNTICSKFDPEGRETIYKYLFGQEHLNSVGRLDYDSEGLLILTNDGDLHLELSHPSFNVHKQYRISVRGHPNEADCKALVTKIDLEDGPGRFENISVVNTGAQSTEFEVTVSEGRNRFIRRMFAALGFEVFRLIREQIGSLKLDIPTGQYRELKPSEIDFLRRNP